MSFDAVFIMRVGMSGSGRSEQMGKCNLLSFLTLRVVVLMSGNAAVGINAVY